MYIEVEKQNTPTQEPYTWKKKKTSEIDNHKLPNCSPVMNQ